MRNAVRQSLLSTERRLLAFRLLLAGEVAAAGADLQVFVAASASLHFNAAVSGGSVRALFVADGVLVADIAGDLLGHRIYLAQILRIEQISHSAGLLRQFFQRALAALLGIFVQQADGVHG